MVDIYSFGMIMYFLFTGKTPFEEYKLYEVPDLVLGGGKPKIPKDMLDECLSNLILQCVEKDPGNRPRYKEIESVLNNYFESLAG